MSEKDDAVAIVRNDGKEFLVKRSVVAEHINRGNFKVKDKKDQPTKEELKKAVGFNLKSVSNEAAVAQEAAPAATPAAPSAPAQTGEKALADLTVPELKEKAKELQIEFPASVKKDDLVELISVKLQEEKAE